MAAVIARWLRRAADWIDPPAPRVDTAVVRLARTLAATQNDRWPDRSGEAKRHQVFAQLIDAFPTTSKRALARAIEDALDKEIS